MNDNHSRDLRPEELDARMDLLDLADANNVLNRLPIIDGVTYRAPRSFEQLFREDFGDGHDPVVLPR
jgi:hypothetical protein